MRMTMRFGGVVLGVVVGSTVGGMIGWALGDFGGRSDPENVWFLCLIAGAAVGLAIATAVILRRAKKLAWGPSLLVGTGAGIAGAAFFIVFVALYRRH
jgi:membrane protein YqaA with SNARE-associated domain